MTPVTGIDFERLTLQDALDLAVLIEEEARDRYVEFAEQLATHHTPEVADFFARMAQIEERHRAELERNHKGEFALIRGDEVVGVFKDEDKALAEAQRRFGLEKVLLQEVGDSVLFFPMCELPRNSEC